MDALDTFQDLTELGYHICDIPIPPRYAKMVLVSVALKCLDPILTIACILAYAEPCKFSNFYSVLSILTLSERYSCFEYKSLRSQKLSS